MNMIYGNHQSQKVLADYFENIQSTGQIPFNFLLITGPANVGKTTVIKKYVQDLLGQYYKTDFLYIPDLSWHLGKKHTLKIEVDKKDQIIDIDENTRYQDMGTRDIVEWIFRSGIGTYKIVLLENIERMSLAAANAFLKTFEEPLQNRIIIATTSNVNAMLDTILSRAFIIKFELLSYDEVKQFLQDNYTELSSSKADLLASFSMGRIGFAIHMMNQSPDTLDELFNLFQSYLQIIDKSGVYQKNLEILSQVNKLGYLDIFLDAVIFWLNKENKLKKVDKILKTKRLINANVNMENALFYLGT